MLAVRPNIIHRSMDRPQQTDFADCNDSVARTVIACSATRVTPRNFAVTSNLPLNDATPSRRTVLSGSIGAAILAGLPLEALAFDPSLSTSRPRTPGDSDMPMITTKDGTQIFYKDWGKGQPIVFHHGWPLSSDDWDAQMLFFLAHGYRVNCA
jgi:hypothetical protein